MEEKPKKKRRKGAGRPRKPFDNAEFEKLCAIQCTEVEICGWFGISRDTLNARLKENYGGNFSQVSIIYKQDGRISLRRLQFQIAQKHPSMAIWLGKQHLEQKDNNVLVDNSKHYTSIKYEWKNKDNNNSIPASALSKRETRVH